MTEVTLFERLSNKITGHSYFDIMLYNNIVSTYENDKKKKPDEQDKEGQGISINDSLDSLISIYDKLFSFGFSLSGYQFIGLVLEKTIVDNDNKYAPLAYFLLAIGFLISLFGSMSSFFILEFLTSIKNEEPEFIVHSIQKYKTIFKFCSEALLYVDCILFLIPINILIYNVLNDVYGLAFNILSGILFILGLIFSYCVIVAKQEFDMDTDKPIKRRIYNKKINGECSN